MVRWTVEIRAPVDSNLGFSCFPAFEVVLGAVGLHSTFQYSPALLAGVKADRSLLRHPITVAPPDCEKAQVPHEPELVVKVTDVDRLYPGPTEARHWPSERRRRSPPNAVGSANRIGHDLAESCTANGLRHRADNALSRPAATVSVNSTHAAPRSKPVVPWRGCGDYSPQRRYVQLLGHIVEASGRCPCTRWCDRRRTCGPTFRRCWPSPRPDSPSMTKSSPVTSMTVAHRKVSSRLRQDRSSCSG